MISGRTTLCILGAWAIGIAFGCACSRSTATTSLSMSCEGIQIPRVGDGNGLRCENDEAVCYGTPSGALSCWRK